MRSIPPPGPPGRDLCVPTRSALARPLDPLDEHAFLRARDVARMVSETCPVGTVSILTHPSLGSGMSYDSWSDTLRSAAENGDEIMTVGPVITVGDSDDENPRVVRLDGDTLLPLDEDVDALSPLDQAELLGIVEDFHRDRLRNFSYTRRRATRDAIAAGAFTQTDLARRLGLTPQAVSKWLAKDSGSEGIRPSTQ